MRSHLADLLTDLPCLLLALAAAGCAASSPDGSPPPSPAGAAPDRLWGTSWLLEDIGGSGVIDYARASWEFPEAAKVAGRASHPRQGNGAAASLYPSHTVA